MCASHSPGGIPPGSFHQPPRSIRNPSSKSGLVLFLLGVVPVQTHSQQDLSGSFHEKNVTFFSWAQKMQINNSLLLISPKTAPRFGRPVFQLPPRGSWEECARGWVLGGDADKGRPIAALNKSFETEVSVGTALPPTGKVKTFSWRVLSLQLHKVIGRTAVTFTEPEKMLLGN